MFLWGVGCGSACACCLHARSVYILTRHALVCVCVCTCVTTQPGVYASIFMVCLFAYLGVATRVLLEKGVEHLANTTLSDRYPDNFGTLTAMMGTKQLGAGYWPANIVGCIVLGIFLRIAGNHHPAHSTPHTRNGVRTVLTECMCVRLPVCFSACLAAAQSEKAAPAVHVGKQCSPPPS